MIEVSNGSKGLMPAYATEGSAAFDLAVPDTILIPALSYREIQFHLVFRIPKGRMLYVRPRNSTFKKFSLIFVGSGIIDEDYCGPEDKINFPVYNPTYVDVTIYEGTRIAQGMIINVERHEIIPFVPVGKSRGGTGSTGM